MMDSSDEDVTNPSDANFTNNEDGGRGVPRNPFRPPRWDRPDWWCVVEREAGQEGRVGKGVNLFSGRGDTEGAIDLGTNSGALRDNLLERTLSRQELGGRVPTTPTDTATSSDEESLV